MQLKVSLQAIMEDKSIRNLKASAYFSSIKCEKVNDDEMKIRRSYDNGFKEERALRIITMEDIFGTLSESYRDHSRFIPRPSYFVG